MGIRDLFKPREDKFMRLLIEQAAKTVEGMELLEEFMEGTDKRWPRDSLRWRRRLMRCGASL
ncbi:MAG: hypothetical protein WBW48_09900 [Anaerolineae bacterium]